jgi:ferritin
VQELLNLRTQFEEITDEFKLEKYGSDINTLNWFVENGHKSNSLRDGYKRALEIAEAIITEHENDRQKNNRGFG